MTATIAQYSRSAFHMRGPLAPIPENESCDWSSMINKHRSKKHRRSSHNGGKQRGSMRLCDDHLVNQERANHNLPALKKSSFLENLANMHALALATRGRVEHSANDVQELQARLHSKCVGENVQSGASVRAMHEAQSDVLRRNILGNFNQFGVGTAKGTDGKIYMCQLFRTV